MNTYTIRQVAAITNSNEETVRRWIRLGELKGTMRSKKKGYVITQEDLDDFLQKRRKYSNTITCQQSNPIVSTIQEEIGEYILEHLYEITQAITVRVLEDMLENLKVKEEP